MAAPRFVCAGPARSGDAMFFLIRSAFWFSLVLLLLPFRGPDGALVGPLDTFLAARDALADISGLCGRRPEVCVVGQSALTTLGSRARDSAALAYSVLDARFGGPPITGSVAVAASDEVTGAVRKIIADPAEAAALGAALAKGAAGPPAAVIADIGRAVVLPDQAPVPVRRTPG